MSTILFGSRSRQKGVALIIELGLFGLLSTLLTSVAILKLGGSTIEQTPQVTQAYTIIDKDFNSPGSVSAQDINNALQNLQTGITQIVQSAPPGVNAGLGLTIAQQAQSAMQEIHTQPFVVQIVQNPIDPAPGQGVDVTITVLNAPQGTQVQYSLVGTDNYKQGDTLSTDQNGQVSFHVPGGAAGVVDTITVTVGPVTQTFSYTF